MKKYIYALCLVVCLSFFSYLKVTEQQRTLNKIEKFHGAKQWWKTKFLRCHVQIKVVGGQTKDSEGNWCKGVFIFETNGDRIYFKNTDLSHQRAEMLFVNGHTWIKQMDNKPLYPIGRFHLLTWPWFIATPFKLTNKQTVIDGPHHGVQYCTRKNNISVDNNLYTGIRQSFMPEMGITPDDWYYLYLEKNGKIKATRYIVTHWKEAKEANNDQRILIFDDYKKINGIVLSTKYRMFQFKKKRGGIYKYQHAEGFISNIEFIYEGDEKEKEAKSLLELSTEYSLYPIEENEKIKTRNRNTR